MMTYLLALDRDAMSNTDARATLLTKQSRRLPAPRLPLDFARLVAQWRANRVAEYKQLEASNHLQWSIQKAIELENQFTERHKMEDRLRLGGLLASISHPIAAVMARGAAPAAMEVDQPEVNHDHQFYQKAARLKDSAAGIPNLEDFDDEENKLSRRKPKPGDPPYGSYVQLQYQGLRS